ncbi:MAG: histidine kinase-, gyrase and HSP90-like ATPase family protein, partial [Firmicutes bacterium]|nr:histidine kinase-, gyrase and HSP90-like ATPase family protein [Bacillota bacterium]
VTIALLVIIFCVAVAIIHSDRRVLKIENNLLKEQNEIQFANYIAMQQKDMEIHKLYHDIGNHISTIQILVDQGDTQEAKEYTRRLNEQYNGLKKGLYCNNKIINAVLLQKLKVCEESGIRYELELSIPQSLPFQDIDLMCIYSNLLDNAIEGCQRNSVTDNYIKIKTAQIGNYLGIKIINSKSAEHSMPDGDSAFGTSKKDKSVHGYGLRIIEEIVKHYDGYKELQEERKEFSAMVMLKLTSAVEN